MNVSNIKTPGVYINEADAFGNSVVPVATAVPAFIGYTPQAIYEGKSYANTPTKITSFADFQAIFCYPDPPAPADPAKQYTPQYYFVKQNSKPEQEHYLMIGNDYYAVVPDPNTIYYLYNSIRLFYQNGGGDAYIVSVGTYGTPSGVAMTPGDQIVNKNVQLTDLTKGLTSLKNKTEPTMYICPEATLLSVADNSTLMQEMLLQCSEMQTAISIFDVIGGRHPDPISFMDDIITFRERTGNKGLDYGVAYYPFVGTTIMQRDDIDYTNLFGGDIKPLVPLINPPSNPDEAAATILSAIENPSENSLTVRQYNSALINASPIYATMMNHVLTAVNMLPPSGGMAGVITMTDNQVGPWQSPANTSIVGVSSLPIRLSSPQQEYLNVDAVSGKSINAIRFFNGQGILVWGARTLDGNSLNWQYISVRRTIIYIEQSAKLAAQAYVFSPNTKNTWEAVKAMISSFLTGLWKQGGLIGSKATDAFSVECGLGSTMTGEDILNGFMKVTMKVAVLHPAEFIIITFRQQMPTSS